MSSTAIVIIVVVVVVILVALAAFFFLRRQSERQERAREEYGPEYERTVEERGSERQAEKELRERRERVESEVQPLSDESRSRYQERWDEVERAFVDDPVASLRDADRVVRDILEERNFPTESGEEAAKDIGVMHSDVVEGFREAQRTHQEATGSRDDGGDRRSDADSEKMRQAIQKYRSVYERLTKD